jgi:hypothetical protein
MSAAVSHFFVELAKKGVSPLVARWTTENMIIRFVLSPFVVGVSVVKSKLEQM